jgi:stearoyl-CoA desaturase (delta-9 desaturase)
VTAIVEPVLDEAELAELEAELPALGRAADTEPEIRPMWEQVVLYLFVLGPFAALIAVIVCGAAFGFAPSLVDCILASIFYAITGYGVTVGLHRYFTHGSFKANRGLKIGLGIAGSMAVQGPLIRWVADHRKHHANSDKEGDPHSPWRFGRGPLALTKGFWWSHTGWLFDREQTSKDRYAPDLVADPDLRKIHALFPVITVFTIGGPALLGGLITMSWWGAFTALIWAGLVRIGLLHHVTWSINSVCHIWGKKPFVSRDESRNVGGLLAVLSLGESWHNLHHAEPTSARHGVERGQVDLSARLIALFEHFGWARDVRWPKPERLDRKRVAA